MKETLKDPKYAKMKLVDIVYGDDQPEKSTTVCEGLLSTHPDLRGIISPTSVGLAAAAQTIKLADLISNSRSIMAHDPNFARTYLEEKRMLLEVMTKGDPGLHAEASKYVGV